MAGEVSTLGYGFAFNNGVGPLPVPEKIVRPFESFKERRDQRIAELRAPPGTEEEQAQLCWGVAPELQGSTANPPADLGGFRTKKSTEEVAEEEPQDPGLFEWSEIERRFKKIRVQNPQDSEQYVIVERIEKIAFRAPSQPPFNGYIHVFTFKNRTT